MMDHDYVAFKKTSDALYCFVLSCTMRVFIMEESYRTAPHRTAPYSCVEEEGGKPSIIVESKAPCANTPCYVCTVPDGSKFQVSTSQDGASSISGLNPYSLTL